MSHRRTHSLLVAALISTAVLAAGATTVDGPAAVAASATCTRPLLDEAQPAQDALPEVPDATVADLNKIPVRTLQHEAAEDDALWLDECGRLFVVDELPTEAVVTAPTTPVANASVKPADAFSLHSRKGASKVIYLDFRGRTLSGTAWNTSRGRTSIPLGAYDTNGVPGTFTDAERAAVAAVWESVAADYAAWDVDVTTQDPGTAALSRTAGTDTKYGIRVVVTSKSSGMQAECGCGGIAYVNVFEHVGVQYQPALVFAEALGSAKAIAEAASHEAGHNFGLFHDGDANAGYHTGTDPWAPIMGVGYYQPVSQWSRGEYATATNQQDDTAIIGRQLGVAADDHPGTTDPAAATRLGTSLTGLVTGPDDADSFVVSSATPMDVFAEPLTAWSNLDVELTVTDASGSTVQVVNPGTSRVHAALAQGLGATATLPAGTHVVTVRGADGPGYSSYGSTGAYRVRLRGEPTGQPLTTATTVPSGVVGQAVSQPVVTGGTPPYTWTGVPKVAWLTFGADGRLTGTPTAAMRAAAVTPTVTDADGRTATFPGWRTFLVQTPLTIPVQVPAKGTTGRSYSTTLRASGAVAPYTWTASGLPDGLVLKGALVTGVPQRSGTYPVEVTVRSGLQTRTSTLTLTIVDPAVTLRTPSPTAGKVGTAYRFALLAAGGSGSYTWTATGVPAGLTLSSDGVLSGTPVAAGTARIAVRVVSGTATYATTLSLVVRP
ncbi:zinc-dependent metalloprotease family protein [Aeromicrobium massiliense]|uniref:zinc-dependent metalloprotease family protein n=1 Tax=Aeromicrobium massiliense TaxID=1464554 RepID=UPI000B10178B|nr:zinc-dependent metalloprotease family protein [Aeromicrobium massiliense]